MESWMITAVIVISGLIGNIYVFRYMVSELKSKQEIIFTKLEKHGDDLVELNTKSKLGVTAEFVDSKYVSKELFRQFEKHMDDRFDDMSKKQDIILDEIRKQIQS